MEGIAKEESWHDFCWGLGQMSEEAEPRSLSRVSKHRLKLLFRSMSVNRKYLLLKSSLDKM